MNRFRVDANECRRDGICAAVCPRRIIAWTEGELPVVAPEDESFCLTCGHCVAVCPHGAASVAGVSVDDCPPLEAALRPSWPQVRHFLRSRRSIRVYRDRTVPRDTLQQLIEVARYAPTASNSQTVHWTVLSGREQLRPLSECTIGWMRGLVTSRPGTPIAERFGPYLAAWDRGEDGILRNAPNLVVASAPKEASNGLVDCTIALAYFELAALPLGVGTCWAGLLQAALLNHPKARELLALPEGHTAHYPMMVGYPRFSYQRLPERREPAITWR